MLSYFHLTLFSLSFDLTLFLVLSFLHLQQAEIAETSFNLRVVLLTFLAHFSLKPVTILLLSSFDLILFLLLPSFYMPEPEIAETSLNLSVVLLCYTSPQIKVSTLTK